MRTAAEVLESVERALGDRRQQSSVRREVAAELFYGPGGATRRALHELYDVLELTAPALPRQDQESSDSDRYWSTRGSHDARRAHSDLQPCRTARSHAREPSGGGTAVQLPVIVTVADNRSTDDTASVVAAYHDGSAGVSAISTSPRQAGLQR